MTEASMIWATIVDEFSDIPDLQSGTRILLRLCMALLMGAAIGYERERRGKAAGLRTHMLVSLGAAMAVLVPLQAGMEIRDVSRVVQGIVAGIGFLGAGAIIKLNDDKEIHGLTTAASIWLAASIGVAAGMGKETTALACTLLALVVLAALRPLEDSLAATPPNRQDDKG